jgi:hypothetical protein
MTQVMTENRNLRANISVQEKMIASQAHEIEQLRGALEALKHGDGCYCDAAFALTGTIVMHSPECIAARAVLAQKEAEPK